jgi:hypothetical protein
MFKQFNERKLAAAGVENDLHSSIETLSDVSNM